MRLPCEGGMHHSGFSVRGGGRANSFQISSFQAFFLLAWPSYRVHSGIEHFCQYRQFLRGNTNPLGASHKSAHIKAKFQGEFGPAEG